jgi:tetratricopeptide (TPR) repeat protein
MIKDILLDQIMTALVSIQTDDDLVDVVFEPGNKAKSEAIFDGMTTSPKAMNKEDLSVQKRKIYTVFITKLSGYIDSVVDSKDEGESRNVIDSLKNIMPPSFQNDTKQRPSTAGSSKLNRNRSSDALFQECNISKPVTSKRKSLSWGQVVDYLRKDCTILKDWQQEIESFVLPQHRVAIELGFQLADTQKRGVAHPYELIKAIKKCAVAAKAVTGDTFFDQIKSTRCEVLLTVNMMISEVIDVTDNFVGENGGPGSSGDVQRVGYELPLTLDETLSIYLLEVASENPLPMLRLQALSLSAVQHMFCGELDESEDSLKEALQILADLNVDSDMISCELYNSIAQLMILKHRQWHSDKKSRCKKEAIAFMGTEDGKIAVDDEMKKYLGKDCYMDGREDVRILLSQRFTVKQVLDIENKAKSAILKARMKFVTENEADITAPSVEAAYRYLVKSYEILEALHGPVHPSIGAACLAIASVQNAVGKFSEAREWLTNALQAMMKLDPMPLRAIAFTEIQLSSVLAKQKHIDEAIQVLSKAISFYLDRVRQGLSKAPSPFVPIDSPDENMKSSSVSTMRHSEILSDDIQQCMLLMQRLVCITDRVGGTYQSLEQMETIADVAESAFGWDSDEVGKYRKEAGVRAMELKDWPRAIKNLNAALEATDALYGRQDKRYIDINAMLSKVGDYREALRLEKIDSVDDPISDSRMR